MLSTTSRWLRLLSLLQTSRTWTGTELADRLNVTVRTVRKDIDRLRQLGYSIESNRGAIGGYRLGPGGAMPPLILDDEEAIAIAVGLNRAQEAGIAGLEDSALSALRKLEVSLPNKLRNRVAALGATSQVRVDQPPAEIDSELLSAIATARRTREKLRISYKRHDGDESRRMVEPHHIVNWGHRWYLIAWDDDRADWRTFRVDRISRALPTGVVFRGRQFPEEDVSRYIAQNVSRAGWKHVATVEVFASASQVLASIHDAVGTVEPIDDNHCILRVGADSVDTIAVYLGMLGHEFRVIETPELIAELRRVAERYTRAIADAT